MAALPLHQHQHRPAPRHRGTHHHVLMWVVVVLGAAALAVTAWGMTGARDAPSAGGAPTAGTVPDSPSGAAPPEPSRLEATLGSPSTAPMEAVSISGRIDGTGPGTALAVQMRVREGRWVSFPLRPVVDETGRWTTYVEIGEPGSHKLRVIDPASGVSSRVLVLRVR